LGGRGAVKLNGCSEKGCTEFNTGFHLTDYYEENHKSYFSATVNIDPSSFLTPLLKYLHPSATILDIGCGSGRDLLWLTSRGYGATGLERSAGLANLARLHSGCTVLEGDFMDFMYSDYQFDALTSIGSFVHLSHRQLSSVLALVCQSLVPSGLFLITLKKGEGGTHSTDGRVFYLWQEDDLELLFLGNRFEILHCSRQTSRICAGDKWLGYTLRLIKE
jgi:SAM-dependent methyltransferase